MSSWRGRFDEDDGDPLAAMATLVDVMLVFACGLMAALLMNERDSDRGTGPAREAGKAAGGQTVERLRQLPHLPDGVGQVGGGFRPVGRVFRDPSTGKLILVESAGSAAHGAADK